MPITWSREAQDSLFEILKFYEFEVSQAFADLIESRIFEQVDAINGFELSIPRGEVLSGTRKLVISKLPYVAFIREKPSGQWEVVDIVHTARRLPKSV